MRRLFWVGVGAVGAVIAVDRLRRAARRYTPAGVSEQVDAASRATTSALHEALDQLRASMAQREKDLVATLLVTPEGGDPDAVFGRRRADRPTADEQGARRRAQDDTGGRSGPGRESARPTGRVDDDEPLYDF